MRKLFSFMFVWLTFISAADVAAQGLKVRLRWSR
jgi:hypothetical protein